MKKILYVFDFVDFMDPDNDEQLITGWSWEVIDMDILKEEYLDKDFDDADLVDALDQYIDDTFEVWPQNIYYRGLVNGNEDMMRLAFDAIKGENLKVNYTMLN